MKVTFVIIELLIYGWNVRQRVSWPVPRVSLVMSLNGFIKIYEISALKSLRCVLFIERTIDNFLKLITC